ncbi:calcium/sodium antiporter [Cerasicoccus arenae]|uniref:Sodium:calcium antiporter n=2 Tax=Cerasicoccus arenae TaxID=424488 RepID=A0A8J3DEC9_9BACT|nr:calcium/sodium antiporter [Cerasicoccus arenae]MBK1858456.1 calcium/sodium antiporter [Cerasicoccus arenae]GHC10543.1 sodium:calcium antiporter [Cerasicoccus arenae]
MLLVIAGIVLLYFGAEGLVRGSSNLAIRAGIPPLVVGLTVVAFGTSAPELTVSISASLQGKGVVALGNVVGSNIFNIAVILGISALIRPLTIHINLLRRDIPIMIGAAVVGFGLILYGDIGRIAGIALLLMLTAYLVFTIHAAKRETAQGLDSMDAPEPPKNAWWLDVIFLVVGLGLLVWGANLFVEGAIVIARKLGVSEAVIGLTIVAAGTSLPELATSIVAAIKKQTDIAVGNVVGSNIFNILCILGTTAVVKPISADGISWIDGAVMLLVSVILLPLAFTQRTISRGEGGFLMVIYGGFLIWLWP